MLWTCGSNGSHHFESPQRAHRRHYCRSDSSTNQLELMVWMTHTPMNPADHRPLHTTVCLRQSAFQRANLNEMNPTGGLGQRLPLPGMTLRTTYRHPT